MFSGWNPIFLKHRFHILHFPNSNAFFTKSTSCHDTKYRFSPDIELDIKTGKKNNNFHYIDYPNEVVLLC